MTTQELVERLAALTSRLEPWSHTKAVAAMEDAASRLSEMEAEIKSARRTALEEAAVIAETWFDHHRPQQPKKSRFDIYDIEHWAKSATRLVAEDIRARADPKGEA